MKIELENLSNLNRREFLKRISLIAGTTAIATYVPWLKIFKEDIFALDRKIRLGIIGVGSRGTILLQIVNSFAKELNVEIAAVCDDYEPHYKEAIKLTNGKAKSFYDYRKLLELKNLDAVIVATPLHQHAHITVDALNHGFHVFCEKSMARTLDDTKLMYDTHLKTNRILQIGHQRMFSPIYLAALQKIHNNEIGKITQMRAYWHRNSNWRREIPKDKPELEKKLNWRLYHKSSAGLFTELMSHQIQVTNWIKKSYPVSVVANGSINYWKDGREVYDDIACLFDYEDGSQLVYDSITSNMHFGLEEQILGTKGTMELETNKIYDDVPPEPPAILKLLKDLEAGIFDTIPIGGSSWNQESALDYKSEYISDNYKMDETKLSLEAFIRYIRKGKAPEELTIQGYYATVWSLLAEQAAETRQRISLPDKYRI